MKTKKLRWWEENELDGEENEKKKGRYKENREKRRREKRKRQRKRRINKIKGEKKEEKKRCLHGVTSKYQFRRRNQLLAFIKKWYRNFMVDFKILKPDQNKITTN